MISHAGPIAGIIHYLTGMPFEQIFKIDTAGITKINLKDFSVQFVSQTCHLNVKDVGVRDS